MAVIVIPAYNPDQSLVRVVEKLWAYGCETIVVDDGSEKKYQPVFEELRELCILLRHTQNQGKGAAIKTALTYIKQELWEHQLVGIMDADGQHLPEDMMKLLECAEAFPDAMVLGVRSVGKEMPLRSRMGNLLTRAFFELVTGVKLTDTQTGMRFFRAELIEEMLQIKGERYEYEMNVLLHFARRHISFREVQINTIYRDVKNSTSHFRVLQDSFKIYKELLLFTLSSLSGFFIDYLLFSLFVWMLPEGALAVAGANVAARVISALWNYGMNCRLVFHSRWRLSTAIPYFALAVLILLLNNMILELLMQMWGVSPYIAKLMTECILFLLSWTVQRGLIFKERKKKEAVRV